MVGQRALVWTDILSLLLQSWQYTQSKDEKKILASLVLYWVFGIGADGSLAKVLSTCCHKVGSRALAKTGLMHRVQLRCSRGGWPAEMLMI